MQIPAALVYAFLWLNILRHDRKGADAFQSNSSYLMQLSVTVTAMVLILISGPLRSFLSKGLSDPLSSYVAPLRLV